MYGIRQAKTSGREHFFASLTHAFSLPGQAQVLQWNATRLLPRPSNINRGGVWLHETSTRLGNFSKLISFRTRKLSKLISGQSFLGLWFTPTMDTPMVIKTEMATSGDSALQPCQGEKTNVGDNPWNWTGFSR